MLTRSLAGTRCCPRACRARGQGRAALGRVARRRLALEPQLFVVDAAENAGRAYAVLERAGLGWRARRRIAVVERNGLDRFRWEEVVDEVLYRGAPEAEIGCASRSCDNEHRPQETRGCARPADARRRHVPGERAGASARPHVQGVRAAPVPRCERPGVCSRGPLMREVWGRDFYGGTGPSTCTWRRSPRTCVRGPDRDRARRQLQTGHRALVTRPRRSRSRTRPHAVPRPATTTSSRRGGRTPSCRKSRTPSSQRR